ncbi:hypothetical protein FACS189472_13450 [Alphaproteobacteria bacterium]|nr:hypothetical protein FACS189472_13450 [Alphaproteobacteria bacterium]
MVNILEDVDELHDGMVKVGKDMTLQYGGQLKLMKQNIERLSMVKLVML